MAKKILIYTDSRGQHTPTGVPVFDTFPKRIGKLPGISAELILCPMKWTTTIDFLSYLEEQGGWQTYDQVILQTGIVDWSPRPQQSAIGQLYNNTDTDNLDQTDFDTRDYSRKIVNNKKAAFDRVFGEEAMKAHLASAFDVEFEGQPTVNMYSLDMAEASLLPRLAEIENLVFVNSNRFISGWEGDYKRGRPKNIKVTEQYSELFRDVLGADRVVDILRWDEEEVKTYTCDNLHLTERGNEWILEEMANKMELPNQSAADPAILAAPERSSEQGFSFAGRPIETPVALTDEDRQRLRASRKLDKDQPLASLIIGVRFPSDDPSRKANLKFLLEWIDRYYGDLFEVLLVEQDIEPQLPKAGLDLKPYVRTEFLYNPYAFNRGWGYNVAASRLTDCEVLAFLDTDVLLGANFAEEITACHTDYDAISPYANIYFTDEEEANEVRRTGSLERLTASDRVQKPTSITGGVVIVRRDVFLSVNGFEQYTSYGGEDRALDVTLLSLRPEERLRIAPYVYVHMHHPGKEIDKSSLQDVLKHLEESFGCSVDRTLGGADYIHQNCLHKGRAKVENMASARAESFGDPELYSSGKPLTVNGLFRKSSAPEQPKSTILVPRTFNGLDDYTSRELYDAADPDTAKLHWFYNRFAGERCFIVGNGPSLNQHDLSLLKNEYSFAVNSIFYKTRESGYRPTFYVVEDNSVMMENAADIREFEAPYKFFPTIYRRYHPEGRNVTFFEMNRGFYEKNSPNYCVPRFSTDASKVLYCGQSVTYINLQLAYFMGFSEVHLIGMDFDYVIPKEHERDGDLIRSTTDDPNHFHKDYFGKGKTWKDPKLERVGMNYRMAKLAYEAVGRRIFNSTVGGKLEIFERRNYYDLFENQRSTEPPTPRIIVNSSRPSSGRTVSSPGSSKAAATIAEPVVSATHTAQEGPARPQGGRPVYAGFGDWLRGKSPGLFALLRLSRRGAAGLWRRRVLVLAGLLIVAAPLFIALLPGAEGAELLLIGLSAFLLLLGALGYVALRSYVTLNAILTQIADLRSGGARAEKKFAALKERFEKENTASQLATLSARLDRQISAAGRNATRLGEVSGKLEQTEKALQSHRAQATKDLDGLSGRLAQTSRKVDENGSKQLGIDLAVVARYMRPLWLGGSASERAELEVDQEHGHGVLMRVLADIEAKERGFLAGKTLIEIGVTREPVWSQRSTQKLALFCLLTDLRYIGVDMDPENIKRAKALLAHINPGAHAVADKGEDFLKVHSGSIDIVYLDAFDFDHGKHSEARQAAYERNLGTRISDKACWDMHENCARTLVRRMDVGGIIALDDTWKDENGAYHGKGRTAMPLLLENGFEIMAETDMTICLRRVSRPGKDGASNDA